MNSKGLSGGIYKPLSPEGIDTIHNASLTILEKTGFAYESGLDATIEMLANAGATIDREMKRIRFPRELILESIAKAPSQVILYARDGKNDLDLTEDKVHLGTGGAAVKILDMETGLPRSSTLKDLYDLGRLVDRLDHIHFFLRPCIPTDIPEADYDVNMFYACLKATGKHVMSGVNDEAGLHRIIDMAALLAGGKAAVAGQTVYIDYHLVCHFTAEAVHPIHTDHAGLQSPGHPRGLVRRAHVRLHQPHDHGRHPGPAARRATGGYHDLPVDPTRCAAALRRHSGHGQHGHHGLPGGGVECGMMNAAIHQMAAHIDVPNYNSAGLTDAKLPDAQAGWEKAMTILLGAMGGSNYMHHSAGMLESMLTVAPEQYVIDDEIIGMACKVLKGIEVDAEHLAIEVIDTVGPSGNFMMSPHTMKYMRSEYFQGNGVTDSKSRHQWEQGGSMDTRERGKAIARKILEAPESPYIPEDIDLTIRKKFNILL